MYFYLAFVYVYQLIYLFFNKLLTVTLALLNKKLKVWYVKDIGLLRKFFFK